LGLVSKRVARKLIPPEPPVAISILPERRTARKGAPGLGARNENRPLILVDSSVEIDSFGGTITRALGWS
jgi:hypothetical protein